MARGLIRGLVIAGSLATALTVVYTNRHNADTGNTGRSEVCYEQEVPGLTDVKGYQPTIADFNCRYVSFTNKEGQTTRVLPVQNGDYFPPRP